MCRHEAPRPRTPRNANHRTGLAGAQKLMLHVGETTIGVPFTKDQAQQLDAAFQKLLKTVSCGPLSLSLVEVL